MSIFSRIKDAIWGNTENTAGTKTPDTSAKPVVASASGAPNVSSMSKDLANSGQEVDVAAILDAVVKKKGGKLKWRTSIVDLMKALELDSRLSSRRELAKELGYDGDMKSSAKMNIWLHKQVMQKLRENGGIVPSELH